MPIQIDKKPGRKQLRRNGEEAGPIKLSTEPAPPLGSTVRVRMLRDVILSRLGSFFRGKTYVLPHDVARHWVTTGLAEQDKSLDGSPEMK